MSNHDCFDGDRAIGWEGRSSLRRAGRMDTLSQCIASSRDHLLQLQRPEGFWVGELEADSSLESDAILPDYFFWQPPVGSGGYTRRLYPGRADAGRRMTSLPRRLSQYQSHSQSVLGLAAGGCCGIQSGPAKGSRCDPPVGRRGIEEKETMRMQPCFFPVWDTASAAFAAAESSLSPDHAALLAGLPFCAIKSIRDGPEQSISIDFERCRREHERLSDWKLLREGMQSLDVVKDLCRLAWSSRRAVLPQRWARGEPERFAGRCFHRAS